MRQTVKGTDIDKQTCRHTDWLTDRKNIQADRHRRTDHREADRQTERHLEEWMDRHADMRGGNRTDRDR